MLCSGHAGLAKGGGDFLYAVLYHPRQIQHITTFQHPLYILSKAPEGHVFRWHTRRCPEIAHI
jgi:hypothetical protein